MRRWCECEGSLQHDIETISVTDSISSSNAVPLPPSTIVEEDEEDEEEIEEEEEEELVDVPVMETEEEIQEVDVAPPPQTDISP